MCLPERTPRSPQLTLLLLIVTAPQSLGSVLPQLADLVLKDLQCTEHDLLFHSLVPFVHAVTFLSSLSGLSFKTSIRELSLLNSLLGPPPQPRCD